ncbi:CHAT domain-containing protein [Amycolatopsis japonica]
MTAASGMDTLRLRATALSHYELPWLGVDPELVDAIGPDLFPESARVRTGDGQRHWRLDDVVRRSLVQRIGFAGLRDAWTRLPHRPSDDRQWAIDQYVGAGVPVDLESLGLPRLRAVAWLARWLGGTADHVPTGDELARELGVGELLEPLRALAGDHFVGRKEVLRDLEARFREHGGPVLVHGLGGIGKSAVAARHLLNIADRRDALVAYLNFDQSAVDPAEPVSLVAAIARQLTVQVTGHDALSSLATRCHDRLRSGKRVLESPSAGSSGLIPHEDLIKWLAKAIDGERLLIVFDTFEEVQRRDQPIQRRFSDFLGCLTRQLDRPSLVLAGRAAAPELEFDEIHLDGLDHDEAVQLLLRLQPVDDPRGIIERVGTSPLTIHLAAGVLRTAPPDVALRDIALQREVVDGELYRRLLGHIQDPDVRRLAHPGLTLRRVTPALIRDVLAKPCRVDVPDAERASSLFDGLAREAMLVTRTLGGQAVVHRADVRQTMLHRLSEDESVVAGRIHRAAVKFYSGQSGLVARTEEVYHRLMLGQRQATVDKRWDDAILPHLLPTLEDLPPASKAYLAAKSPTLSIPDEDLRQAETEVGRRLVTRRVAELISAGDGEEALSELHAHIARTADESSVLSGLRVQALELLSRFEEAHSLAAAERDRSARSGAMKDFVLFTLHMARMDERLDRAAQAKQYLIDTLGQARRLPPTSPYLLSRLSLLVCLLRLRRYGLPLGEGLAEELSVEAIAVADRLSVKEITAIPGLLRDLAAELGERSPRLLNAALRRIGIANSEDELALDLGSAVVTDGGRLTVSDDLRYFSAAGAREISASYQSEADSALYRDYQTDGSAAAPHSTLPLGDSPDHEAGLARRLHRSGRPAEALPHYGRAIDRGERLAPLLLDRGLAHLALDNVQAAEQDLTQCLRLARRQSQPLVRAHAHRSMGTLSRLSGDIPAALRHYELCLLLYAEEAPSYVPAAQLDQAKALLDAGLSSEADAVLDEALPALRRQSSGYELAQAELVAAGAKLLQDDPEEARKLAASALRRFARLNDDAWVEVAKLVRLRADTALHLSGTPSKAATPGRARDLAERLRDFGLADEASTAGLLGVRLAVHRGQLPLASSLLAQASRPDQRSPIDQRMLWRLATVELAAASGERRALAEAQEGLAELNTARNRQGGIDVVSGAAAHGRELGELAVRLALRQEEPQRLLQVLEQTKAQVYRFRPLAGSGDRAMGDRTNEMRSLAWKLYTAQREGLPTAGLTARLSQLKRTVTRHAWHSSPWGKPRPPADLASVSAQLGDRALVSFARSGETWSAVVVADGDARLVELGIESEVDEQVKRLHADLDAMAPDNLPAPILDVVRASAARSALRLEEVLLAPITRVTGSRGLVIVPSGSLHAVHWAALPSLAGIPVTVAPSATAWLAAEDVAARAGSGPVSLISGPHLPAAAREIDILHGLHPGARILTGAAATVAAALKALDGAELAHIAARGYHEPENALFSRIELADGPLYAHEISTMHRPPKHVVLAADQLARARIRPGDEALGFAGALLASGSATIVAAINRVGDLAAAAVSVELHEALQRGLPMAEALAEVVGRDPLRRPFICLGSGA